MASERSRQIEEQVNDNAGAVELLVLNRDLQPSPTVRRLAATNLNLYATLMDRNLAEGAVPETELVVALETLDDAHSGLALTKS